MRSRQPLRVDLSVRAAVAAGEPFLPRYEPLADAGVARDVIAYLRADAEPLILRVAASGGTADERRYVAGDWFCDAGGEEPRRIPRPRWVAMAGDRPRHGRKRVTWLDAWEQSEHGSWSLIGACGVGVDHRLLVLAACACVRTVLLPLEARDIRPLLAIEAAERWAIGKAGADRVMAAEAAASAYANYAMNTFGPDREFASVAYATVLAARAVRSTRTPCDAAAAVGAAADSGGAGTLDRLRVMAAVVREKIPTAVVLRAASS